MTGRTLVAGSADMTVKPTTYADIHFRSRLEARWAVFFDELGIAWQYEIDQFDDGVTFYTPDFYLPDLDCFVEIKPRNVYDKKKIAMLAKQADVLVYVAFEFPHPELTIVKSAHCWYRGYGAWQAEKQDGPNIWVALPPDDEGISLQDLKGWDGVTWIDDDTCDISALRRDDSSLFSVIDAASLVARNYQFAETSS